MTYLVERLVELRRHLVVEALDDLAPFEQFFEIVRRMEEG